MFGRFAQKITTEFKKLGQRMTQEILAQRASDNDLAPIFPEMRFIRLSDKWAEGGRDPGLWGGAAADNCIFRQFKLKWAPQVTLEFWFRGRPLSATGGQALCSALSVSQVLDPAQLLSLGEVLGPISEALDRSMYNPRYEIEAAQVGPLHGRNVLQLKWGDSKSKRKVMSVYVDANGDGRIVHEIHFSAPEESFSEHEPLVVETLRSLQWAGFAPPPLSSIG